MKSVSLCGCQIYNLYVDDTLVLARYVETCRGVKICEIIVHLLVIVQNNKRYMINVLK